MWSQEELAILSQMCFQVNAFSSDGDDEFFVVREDGLRQGIFKTWAVPVTPFLDAGNLDVLWALWPKILAARRRDPSSRFGEILVGLARSGEAEVAGLAQTALLTIESWNKRIVENPARLEQSLERARLFSWLLDKRLAVAFRAEPLANELPRRITQLVNRLCLAFGLMNPFYNLEALAADPRLLGVDEAQASSAAGNGGLDLVAFLLPAALREWVVAEPLSWNGLNWQHIYRLMEEMLADPLLRRILLNLSRQVGVPPEHILFAANALEWIPSTVGGKKSDPIETSEALEQMERVVTQPGPARRDAVSILGRMNALIRFLNWVPLIESGENFKGELWTYASVCDTSSLLLDALTNHPEVWRGGFAEVFCKRLRPQLENLDATSAKGRFLLHLILEEQRLRDAFFLGLDPGWRERTVARVAVSPAPEAEGLFDSTHRIYPLSLVGGKPAGLALASYVVGWERVPKGILLSTSVVEDFLRGDPKLWELILRMDQTEDLPTRLALSRRVAAAIREQLVPRWLEELSAYGMTRSPGVDLWAVRSSAFDEEQARGVYRTLLRVPRRQCFKAFRECVTSFYSEEAVLFRVTTGQGDLPCFAVLFQPYLPGEGGVAEIQPADGGKTQIRVTVGKTAAEVTSNAPGLREWAAPAEVGKVPADLAGIVGLVRKLHETFGPLQLEWARSGDGETILQMVLPPSVLKPQERERGEAQNVVRLGSLDEIGRVETVITNEVGAVALELGPEIRLDSFQGTLLALIVRFGKRIVEIRTPRPISPSSHFANICRHFGMRVTSSS